VVRVRVRHMSVRSVVAVNFAAVAVVVAVAVAVAVVVVVTSAPRTRKNRGPRQRRRTRRVELVQRVNRPFDARVAIEPHVCTLKLVSVVPARFRTVKVHALYVLVSFPREEHAATASHLVDVRVAEVRVAMHIRRVQGVCVLRVHSATSP